MIHGFSSYHNNCASPPAHSVVVLAGSSLTAPIAVSCETTGEGPDVVEIIWSHESSDAPPVNFSRSFLASNPRISQQANRLIFRDIKTSDDGLYVCYFRRYGQTSFQRVNSGCIYVLGEYTAYIQLPTPF